VRVDLIYEKEDILRLIARDLKQRRIVPRADVPIEYKGALRVRLTVDTTDESEPQEASTGPEAAPAGAQLRAAGGDSVDMSAVLAESQRLAADGRPLYELAPKAPRMLAPNESYEYPED